ncbi:MAG TPA: hypothetical protein VGR67_09605 [Candidatus Polarisedimenticolia bacterium]|nr:hypothetical protein [Candidatus Polarisedimenticolia bacterium]
MKPHLPRLLPRDVFLRRVFRSVLLSAGLISGSLGIGVLGYHFCADLAWMDALLNASMILTGMGPVDPLRTAGAKLFASAYALFSGVAFLSIVAVLMAPVVHRFLHRFHLELGGDDPDREL